MSADGDAVADPTDVDKVDQVDQVDQNSNTYGAARVPGSWVVVGELIAAGVTRDVLDCVAAAERQRAEQLSGALRSNRTIGMAQGILMGTQRLTAQEAFEQLRTASQTHNRKLRDIASDVVLTGALPEPPPRHGAQGDRGGHGELSARRERGQPTPTGSQRARVGSAR